MGCGLGLYHKTFHKNGMRGDLTDVEPWQQGALTTVLHYLTALALLVCCEGSPLQPP